MRKLLFVLVMLLSLDGIYSQEKDSVIISLDRDKYYFFSWDGEESLESPSLYKEMVIYQRSLVFVGNENEPNMSFLFKEVATKGNSYAFIQDNDAYVVMSLDRKMLIIYLFGNPKMAFYIDIEKSNKNNGDKFWRLEI